MRKSVSEMEVIELLRERARIKLVELVESIEGMKVYLDTFIQGKDIPIEEISSVIEDITIALRYI